MDLHFLGLPDIDMQTLLWTMQTLSHCGIIILSRHYWGRYLWCHRILARFSGSLATMLCFIQHAGDTLGDFSEGVPCFGYTIDRHFTLEAPQKLGYHEFANARVCRTRISDRDPLRYCCWIRLCALPWNPQPIVYIS